MTSYEGAGVNLDAADELVERIGWRVTSTWTEDVVGGFGGFAAGIQIPAGFEVPVLMMSTDGVGTKAEVARQAGLLEGIGYDLVAMVADDLAAAGAQPIAMTDYVAVGRLDVDMVETLIESITDACSEADIALLGRRNEHVRLMSGFALVLGLATSGGLALVAFTPLSSVWFETLSGLSPELAEFAVWPTRILVPLPALSVLLSLQRAVLVQGRRTSPISGATVVEVAGIALLFPLFGFGFGWIGVTAAFVAFVGARVAGNLYLLRPVRQVLARNAPEEGDPRSSAP